mmetsp:Transcript_39358/g.61356  ORF Transcript_39358/g.61356 Transcript_39358/m.61356 type:complete len:203 (+) Transcript_39358:298-906(+)|eukprot:CAMPEP_0184329448 /NCGR_PEP_ID=MMETSP1049-20130417/144156_1 /TAXON_ID=77928 /ORGANISM="Proteomonas sulcata, Strain CCMP704" /LENGTH=202 /DNA_ID=CAMNT_0026651817 /DNA_START=616 /DNA_END=1224 /DNA_ORIENTATION=-
MWSSKQYVPRKYHDMLDKEGGAKKAYYESIKDSRRTTVTREELVSFVWHYRFKARAGKHWTQDDPYWKGHPCRTISMLADGSIVWDGGKGWVGWDDVTWRFARAPTKARAEIGAVSTVCEADCSDGNVIRQYHPDHGWFPSFTVLRTPDWGFILNAPWEILASFPLSKKSMDKTTSDRILNACVEKWQNEEAVEYNARNDNL